jgi:uncharacterized membrane protein
MMGFGAGIGVLAMVACGVFGALLVAAVVYLLVTALPWRRSERRDSARETLDRRLALGEISPEEYYEREAVLRSADSGARRHPRHKLA